MRTKTAAGIILAIAGCLSSLVILSTRDIALKDNFENTPTPTICIENELSDNIELENETEVEQWWTDDDLEMMACVIYQEAGSNSISDEIRIMVGNVVLNRMISDRFPNTIEEVLTQKSQYGEFYWTGVKWADRAKEGVEQEAVARAYRIAEQVLNGERLLGEDYVWQAEFKQGYNVVYQDGIYFGTLSE